MVVWYPLKFHPPPTSIIEYSGGSDADDEAFLYAGVVYADEINYTERVTIPYIHILHYYIYKYTRETEGCFIHVCSVHGRKKIFQDEKGFFESTGMEMD